MAGNFIYSIWSSIDHEKASIFNTNIFSDNTHVMGRYLNI